MDREARARASVGATAPRASGSSSAPSGLHGSLRLPWAKAALVAVLGLLSPHVGLDAALARSRPSMDSTFTFPKANFLDSPAYDRCKTTHRCNRGFSEYNEREGYLAFGKQAFKAGITEGTDIWLDFEDWKVGTGGLSVDDGYLRGHVVKVPHGGPHLNTFHLGDETLLGPLYLNHTCKLLFDTDVPSLTIRCDYPGGEDQRVDITKRPVYSTGFGGKVLTNNEISTEFPFGWVPPASDWQSWTRNASIAYPLWMADVARADKNYWPKPPLPYMYGTMVATSMGVRPAQNYFYGPLSLPGVRYTTRGGLGVPSAVFHFSSVYLGPSVTVTVRGRYPLIILSRTTIVLDTVISAPPGTLGGFPGAVQGPAVLSPNPLQQTSSPSLSASPFVGTASPCGPGCPATREYLYTVALAGTRDHERQWATVLVNEGQTARGFWRLHATFSDGTNATTRQLRPEAEPDDVATAIREDLRRTGRVAVTRFPIVRFGRTSGKALRRGWTFNITFVEKAGDMPQLQPVFSGTLLGVGAQVVTGTYANGTQVGGSFTATWRGFKTPPLPVTATDAEVKAAFESAFAPAGLLHATIVRDEVFSQSCDAYDRLWAGDIDRDGLDTKGFGCTHYTALTSPEIAVPRIAGADGSQPGVATVPSSWFAGGSSNASVSADEAMGLPASSGGSTWGLRFYVAMTTRLGVWEDAYPTSPRLQRQLGVINMLQAWQREALRAQNLSESSITAIMSGLPDISPNATAAEAAAADAAAQASEPSPLPNWRTSPFANMTAEQLLAASSDNAVLLANMKLVNMSQLLALDDPGSMAFNSSAAGNATGLPPPFWWDEIYVDGSAIESTTGAYVNVRKGHDTTNQTLQRLPPHKYAGPDYFAFTAAYGGGGGSYGGAGGHGHAAHTTGAVMAWALGDVKMDVDTAASASDAPAPGSSPLSRWSDGKDAAFYNQDGGASVSYAQRQRIEAWLRSVGWGDQASTITGLGGSSSAASAGSTSSSSSSSGSSSGLARRLATDGAVRRAGQRAARASAASASQAAPEEEGWSIHAIRRRLTEAAAVSAAAAAAAGISNPTPPLPSVEELRMAAGLTLGNAAITDLIGGSGGAAGGRDFFEILMAATPGEASKAVNSTYGAVVREAGLPPFKLHKDFSLAGAGGHGGGAIELIATTDLVILESGGVRADGGTGRNGYRGGGGGAGGSVLLGAGGTIVVAGIVSARGGAGGDAAGMSPIAGSGGGGGRIAMYGQSADFQGKRAYVSVEGGVGGTARVTACADSACTAQTAVSVPPGPGTGGGPGTIAVLTPGGATYAVDSKVGGAIDTRGALRVSPDATVQVPGDAFPSVASDATDVMRTPLLADDATVLGYGGSIPAPFARNGPKMVIPPLVTSRINSTHETNTSWVTERRTKLGLSVQFTYLLHQPDGTEAIRTLDMVLSNESLVEVTTAAKPMELGETSRLRTARGVWWSRRSVYEEGTLRTQGLRGVGEVEAVTTRQPYRRFAASSQGFTATATARLTDLVGYSIGYLAAKTGAAMDVDGVIPPTVWPALPWYSETALSPWVTNASDFSGWGNAGPRGFLDLYPLRYDSANALLEALAGDMSDLGFGADYEAAFPYVNETWLQSELALRVNRSGLEFGHDTPLYDANGDSVVSELLDISLTVWNRTVISYNRTDLSVRTSKREVLSVAPPRPTRISTFVRVAPYKGYAAGSERKRWGAHIALHDDLNTTWYRSTFIDAYTQMDPLQSVGGDAARAVGIPFDIVDGNVVPPNVDARSLLLHRSYRLNSSLASTLNPAPAATNGSRFFFVTGAAGVGGVGGYRGRGLPLNPHWNTDPFGLNPTQARLDRDPPVMVGVGIVDGKWVHGSNYDTPAPTLKFAPGSAMEDAIYNTPGGAGAAAYAARVVGDDPVADRASDSYTLDGMRGVKTGTDSNFRGASGTGSAANREDWTATFGGEFPAPAPPAAADGANRFDAFEAPWHKVDIFLDWRSKTYKVRLDDVTVALDQPFEGEAVTRLGLYVFDAGVTWFDEIFIGDDDTMGFECPVTDAEGLTLRARNAIGSDWTADDIGTVTDTSNPMVRHESHLSRRERYTHEYHAGLVFFDGERPRKFKADLLHKPALYGSDQPRDPATGYMLTMGGAGGSPAYVTGSKPLTDAQEEALNRAVSPVSTDDVYDDDWDGDSVIAGGGTETTASARRRRRLDLQLPPDRTGPNPDPSHSKAYPQYPGGPRPPASTLVADVALGSLLYVKAEGTLAAEDTYRFGGVRSSAADVPESIALRGGSLRGGSTAPLALPGRHRGDDIVRDPIALEAEEDAEWMQALADMASAYSPDKSAGDVPVPFGAAAFASGSRARSLLMNHRHRLNNVTANVPGESSEDYTEGTSEDRPEDVGTYTRYASSLSGGKSIHGAPASEVGRHYWYGEHDNFYYSLAEDKRTGWSTLPGTLPLPSTLYAYGWNPSLAVEDLDSPYNLLVVDTRTDIPPGSSGLNNSLSVARAGRELGGAYRRLAHMRGGIGACSSNDMVFWRNEGIVLHYANITGPAAEAQQEWAGDSATRRVYGDQGPRVESPGADPVAGMLGGKEAGLPVWKGERPKVLANPYLDTMRATIPAKVTRAQLAAWGYDLEPDILRFADASLRANFMNRNPSPTQTLYAMWMHVHDGYFNASCVPLTAAVASDPNCDVTVQVGQPRHRLAGVALSPFPYGPFIFVNAIWPDGNETVDMSVYQDAATGRAFLARTYYATVNYSLPTQVMQPLWESVKNADGSVNFPLNYHRAFYHEGYDNPDDIYKQRWRLEHREWDVTFNGSDDTNSVGFLGTHAGAGRREWPHNGLGTHQRTEDVQTLFDQNTYPSTDVVPWSESWDPTFAAGAGRFALTNSDTGEVIYYGAENRTIYLEMYVRPHAYWDIQGQGRPVVESRYLSPLDPDNSVWSPSSVPLVRAQPWMFNYRDKNIADNPPHPAVPDLLNGPDTIISSRKAKYVAVSQLTANYLDIVPGVMRIIEGSNVNAADALLHLTIDATYTTPTRADAGTGFPGAEAKDDVVSPNEAGREPDARPGFPFAWDSGFGDVRGGYGYRGEPIGAWTGSVLDDQSVDALPILPGPAPGTGVHGEDGKVLPPTDHHSVLVSTSTYPETLQGEAAPFNLHPDPDGIDRHWQYNVTYGDRMLDFRNFRDRQNSSECPNLHHLTVLKYQECQHILAHVLEFGDTPALTNFEGNNVSYSRALDTAAYEGCLDEHASLMHSYQTCLREKEPSFERLEEWNYKGRECVGGGGQCGPLSNPGAGFEAFVATDAVTMCFNELNYPVPCQDNGAVPAPGTPGNATANATASIIRVPNDRDLVGEDRLEHGFLPVRP